ncbi:MAG TPA: hypothetical protein VM345_19900 [Acidimicrobiales bacterium]|jgi:hypothetical protein|nr:hypothetical protein [Acidimicrobiales bacterium]
MTARELDDITARLEAIAEELAERAIEVLREAVDRGDTGRPDEERRLTRARAAVERAVGILRDGSAGDV